MKIKNIALASLMLLMPVSALAEKIVSYTATSKVSQKDADKLALEGVAMQISSSVNATSELRKSQDAAGEVSTTYNSQLSVASNVLLKGAKIVAGPKKNGTFQSTVTVDVDQLTSKIKFDLEKLRKQMTSRDSVIRLNMLDGDYQMVTADMLKLEKLVDEYDGLLESLSFFEKVGSELQLNSTLDELTEFLMSSLSTVNMDAKLTGEGVEVSISDFAGPIANFPVVLTQDKKNLLSDKTRNDGKVVFPLSKIAAKKASGEVVAHFDLNYKFVRQAALPTKTVTYQAASSGCRVELSCEGDVAECGALQSFLTDAGVAVSSGEGLPQLSAKLSFSDKPNSGKTLYTSRGTVAFKFGNTELVEQPQGVGKDAESAHIKAISKMSAPKILNVLSKENCK